MSLVLLHGLKKPIIRVGRMAGQYAKPRSTDTETTDGVTLPSYRGDLVNRPEFTAAARAPDPELLLRGYERAALTLNFVRALIDGGFADLHHPEYWDLGFVHQAPLKDAYQRIVRSIGDSLDFFEGISGRQVHEATLVDFYASHEGLHLQYEQAQTRFIPRQNRWYNLSTHLPWIGMRTAQLDGAHVEYFRGISNPIAVKIGSAMDAAWLQGLVATLNPQNEPGRLTFIHRFGAKDVGELAAAGSSRRCARPGRRCCGSAIRCTATPRPRPAASRRGASRTSSRSSTWRSASTRDLGSLPRRRAHRAHRRGRHRVHRRRARAHRRRTCSAPTARASTRA